MGKPESRTRREVCWQAKQSLLRSVLFSGAVPDVRTAAISSNRLTWQVLVKRDVSEFYRTDF